MKSLTLEKALALLSLPREVGKDPTSGETILAGIGKYGPYVQRGKTYANLDAADDVFSRHEPRDRPHRDEGSGRRKTLRPRREWRCTGREGARRTSRWRRCHLLDGRYGAYVKWGSVNATIPKGANKDELTLEGDLGIIAARIEATGGVKPARGKAPAKKAAARKEAPAKAKKG